MVLRKSVVVVGAVLLWLMVTVLLSNVLTNRTDSQETLEVSLRLKRALEDLDVLRRRNEELDKMTLSLKQSLNAHNKNNEVIQQIDAIQIELSKAKSGKADCLTKVNELEGLVADLRSKESKGQDFVDGGKHGVIDVPASGPSLEHELARFKLSDNIQELGYFMFSQLKGINSEQSNKISEDFGHRFRSIALDLMSLAKADNAASWREKEHAELQSLMQRRLHYLQNPKDCSKAKKLLCDLNKGCGFGCQLHHAIYCFMVAYGTERTIILNSNGWRYASAGWSSVFLPMSDTCTEVSPSQTKENWQGEDRSKNVDVVEMPIVDALGNRPPYMPLSFPEDLAPRLQRLTSDPAVWFVGQFVKYMMRPQPHLQADIDKVTKSLEFANPIVGIHVRRTDKIGTEAAFHGIEEYMQHVEKWFLLQERIPGRIDKRRVYLASDDPNVLPEARKKYPDYVFIGDTNIAQTAGVGNRYTDASLRGVILDIHFLSRSDYLVCTFSSQVCRVAYEIMQTLHPDPSQWFHSLDDIYYFGGQGAHEETVIYKHDPQTREEIALEPGDTVGIAGNHWDGYSKGQNRRTGGIGLYPSYKTADKKVIVKYPVYPEVPLVE